MRRLAIIDGLISLAAVLFVGLLVMTVAGVQSTEANAKPVWLSCQTPIVCPGSSGTCGGCVAGPQIGVCSTTWVPITCTGEEPTAPASTR